MNKAELIDRMNTSRAQFLQQLQAAAGAGNVVAFSDWSAKDVLSHVAFWHDRAVYRLETLLRGDTPNSIHPEEVDSINAAVYRDHHDWSEEEVARWEEDSFQRLLKIVQSAGEDDLFQAGRVAAAGDMALVQIVEDNTYGHYAEHLETLKKTSGKTE